MPLPVCITFRTTGLGLEAIEGQKYSGYIIFPLGDGLHDHSPLDKPAAVLRLMHYSLGASSMHYGNGAHWEALLPTSLDSGELLLGSTRCKDKFPWGVIGKFSQECQFSMVCPSVINASNLRYIFFIPVPSNRSNLFLFNVAHYTFLSADASRPGG